MSIITENLTAYSVHNSASEKTHCHVRWMVRRDFSEVLAIESDAFEFPWKEEDFLKCLQQRNCIGMVAECAGQVVGFMIYETPKNRIHLLNMAVAPKFRHQGVASQMIQKLVGKLKNQRRNKIVTEVRETNLQALQFLRSLGFRAVLVLKDFYEDVNEDAYVMEYRPCDSDQEGYQPVNRISTRVAG